MILMDRARDLEAVQDLVECIKDMDLLSIPLAVLGLDAVARFSTPMGGTFFCLHEYQVQCAHGDFPRWSCNVHNLPQKTCY